MEFLLFSRRLSVVSCQVEIYNVLGEKVLTEILRTVHDDKVISISKQPNGVYFYRVLNENGNLLGQGKIVIQK